MCCDLRFDKDDLLDVKTFLDSFKENLITVIIATPSDEWPDMVKLALCNAKLKHTEGGAMFLDMHKESHEAMRRAMERKIDSAIEKNDNKSQGS